MPSAVSFGSVLNSWEFHFDSAQGQPHLLHREWRTLEVTNRPERLFVVHVGNTIQELGIDPGIVDVIQERMDMRSRSPRPASRSIRLSDRTSLDAEIKGPQDSGLDSPFFVFPRRLPATYRRSHRHPHSLLSTLFNQNAYYLQCPCGPCSGCRIC